MRASNFLILFLLTSLNSCFRDVHRSLEKVSLSPSDNYEVKSMVGCCGCKALYYNVYRNRLVTEQFVVETACESYQPTKHFFKTDSKGNVVSVKSFVAVTDNSFSIPVTETDRNAFKKLDSIYGTWTNGRNRTIVFRDITGFKDGDKTHFPVGLKMPKGVRYGM